MSQFAFLKPEFTDVHRLAVRAEEMAHSDPRGACVYARIALEAMVEWLYRHDGSLKDPYDTTLAARIHEPTFRKLAGPGLVAKARIVKDLGNRAAHEPRAIAPANAVTSLRELFHLSYWLVRNYAKGTRPPSALQFSTERCPRPQPSPQRRWHNCTEAASRFTETVRAREDAERKRLASETERIKLEAEIAAL